MRKTRKVTILFAVLAVLLTVIMGVVVACSYSRMIIGVRTGGYSAPAGVVFLYAVPFLIGIVICIILACITHKKMIRKER